MIETTIEIDDDDFDAESVELIRFLTMGDDELEEEIAIAKALLKRAGYIVI